MQNIEKTSQIGDILNLEIVKYGHPVLRKKGEKITVFDDQLAGLSKQMLQLMKEAQGIGLAAQQVALNLQFFVVDIPSSQEESMQCVYDGKPVALDLIMPLNIANMQLLEKSAEFINYDEGCLSFEPSIKVSPDRFERIKIAFQDLKGVSHTLECSDILSICIQHEYDHTQGRLIVDYLDKKDLKMIKPILDKIKKESLKKLNAPDL